ncbi:MAG: hypothetical protein OJF52_000340 [Nitrospira sp.]|nr:MAG: hypothetical protein OJF52_000340 [Nitrospira sp.]
MKTIAVEGCCAMPSRNLPYQTLFAKLWLTWLKKHGLMVGERA